MNIDRMIDDAAKQIEKGVKRLVKNIERNWGKAAPHVKREVKKEDFLLKRAGSTLRMTKAQKMVQNKKERTGGECEWCGRDSKRLYNRFNCAIFKHRVCKHCQHDRVRMLGYGLI